MVKLTGEGVISKIETRPSANGQFTNFMYEIMVSASKANSQGIIPTTTIRMSASRELGPKTGAGVKFEAELMPYAKKDGSGTSYFFKALTLVEVSVKKADNTPSSLQDEIDDEFPPF